MHVRVIRKKRQNHRTRAAIGYERQLDMSGEGQDVQRQRERKRKCVMRVWRMREGGDMAAKDTSGMGYERHGLRAAWITSGEGKDVHEGKKKKDKDHEPMSVSALV